MHGLSATVSNEILKSFVGRTNELRSTPQPIVLIHLDSADLDGKVLVLGRGFEVDEDWAHDLPLCVRIVRTYMQSFPFTLSVQIARRRAPSQIKESECRSFNLASR